MQVFLIALCVLVGLLYSALDHLHIGHDELKVDDVNVACRIGASLDVDNVFIVKASDDMDYRIGVAYI